MFVGFISELQLARVLSNGLFAIFNKVSEHPGQTPT